MSGFIVKTFSVAVDGFGAMTYVAKSRGQALAKSWGDYSAYRQVSFKDFLRIARAWRTAPPVGFGRPITVSGKPAFWVGQNSQYVQFVFPNGEVILNSHPLDVVIQ
ncbi:hypothetical protein [Brevundimonas diminuta]|uniref:hypothetical protein n=1 Tax=Brevundimonas diminuta TaxID=293 RepID=UPI00320BAED6